MNYVLIMLFILFSCGSPNRQLSMADIFSDGMVIQRDTTVAIWGSSGLLEIACYQESAANVLNVKPYDNFEIELNFFEKSK